MSQKTDNMIKLALVFFVTLLSFSIGTYVGKKYSDNQHKLSLLEPVKTPSPTPVSDEFANEITTEVAAADLAHNAGEAEISEEPKTPSLETETSSESLSLQDSQKPAALSDAEVAKIAEEFANEDESAEEKLVASITPAEKDVKTIPNEGMIKTIKKTTKAVPTVTQQKPAKKIKAAEITPDTTADARIPASLHTKKDLAPMYYTVQIGSYPTQAEAEKITRELQDKGYKISFVPAAVNGQTWYRVNVGLFGSVKEAQEYKKEFLVKTKMPSAIVQRVLQ